MSVATKLDLRGLVLQVLSDSAASDVPTLAKEVSRRIDDHDLRDAIDQALPLIVQNTITNSRGHVHHGEDDESVTAAPAQRASHAKSGRSWKRDGIRRYAKELRELYATGFGPGTHKPLGEFTIPDCESAMSMHDKIIEGNQAARKRWAEFKTQMATLKVKKISQLPDAALAEVFGDVR
jgi:hypothetical protein